MSSLEEQCDGSLPIMNNIPQRYLNLIKKIKEVLGRNDDDFQISCGFSGWITCNSVIHQFSYWSENCGGSMVCYQIKRKEDVVIPDVGHITLFGLYNEGEPETYDRMHGQSFIDAPSIKYNVEFAEGSDDIILFEKVIRRPCPHCSQMYDETKSIGKNILTVYHDRGRTALVTGPGEYREENPDPNKERHLVPKRLYGPDDKLPGG